jgi:hypothetical protein
LGGEAVQSRCAATGRFAERRGDALTERARAAHTDKLAKHGPDEATAMFHFLSRNLVRGSHKATDEELLQEIVNEMKLQYEKDVAEMKALGKDLQRTRDDEEYSILYPKFTDTAKNKASVYKHVAVGHRNLCSISSFALALVMASMIRRHYIHASWFKMRTLTKMTKVHGTVRTAGRGGSPRQQLTLKR